MPEFVADEDKLQAVAVHFLVRLERLLELLDVFRIESAVAPPSVRILDFLRANGLLSHVVCDLPGTPVQRTLRYLLLDQDGHLPHGGRLLLVLALLAFLVLRGGVFIFDLQTGSRSIA